MTTAARNPVPPADVLRAAPLPQSREAEMALLGAMIYDNEIIGDVVELVNQREMFAFPAHQTIFEAILRLHLDRKPIDLVVLRDELARDRRLESVGGAEYLASLVGNLPDSAHAPEYARTVYEKFVLRNIIETCNRIVHQATQVTEDVEAVREEAERALFQALARGEKGTVRTMTDILHETFQKIQDFHDRKGRLLGMPTGFYELDDLLSGLQAGQLYIIAGRPSMGKTSLAMSIIENVALKEQKRVLFFSLEMAAEQIAQQMLCSHTRVPSHLLRTGKISEEDYYRLTLAAGTLSEARIFIDDSADLSALEVRTRARRMKAKEGLDLVVVDYLQKMHARQGNRAPESRQLEIAMISSNLKAMAKELNVPVIALAQLNRAPEGREDRKPMLSDLRESGAIEQDADAVMLLYREEYYNPDTEKKGVAEVILAKNRTGPTDTVELAFLKDFTRFENLAARPT
ncbi:MAG TPA: replicative DNA helicase [Planctomycetota bacterium]|jgi:replicative DNA helicase|nr:replicative DNA helicase [Planctomycetota bacterium]